MKLIFMVYFTESHIPNVIISTCNHYKKYEWDLLHFYPKFSESATYFILSAHLDSNQQHFQCSVATCGWWPVATVLHSETLRKLLHPTWDTALLCRGTWMEAGRGRAPSESLRAGGLGIDPCVFQGSLPAWLSSF